jgi:NAD(P)-dependent dehydrogenase (short-subunit alcohol dehydrogenase family)
MDNETPAGLRGRVAIVTGAGTDGPGVGVGKATSLVLARQGMRLVLTDINEERVRETEKLVVAAGAEALVCLGDVGSPADCERVVDAAAAAFGQVDVLVNNAALSTPGTVVTTSPADWERILAVTLMGTVNMARPVIPLMEAAGSGSIVNISSICAHRGYRNAAYTAAKGGMEALTRDMATSHGRAGVRVNVIAPGHLDTPRVASVSHGTAKVDIRAAASPLGTAGNAWDVAWAVEFLASDRARWINGVTLPVDGGVLATSYLSMVPIIAADQA